MDAYNIENNDYHINITPPTPTEFSFNVIPPTPTFSINVIPPTPTKPSDNFSFNMTKKFEPKDSSTNYVSRKRKTTGVDLPKKKKLHLAEEHVVLKLKKRNSGNWQLRQYKSPLGRIKLRKRRSGNWQCKDYPSSHSLVYF